MPKFITYLSVIVLVIVLVLIRLFENTLFYDPYLTFFQNDYLYLDSPRRELLKLVGYTTLRYVLNTLVSLALIQVVFKDLSILKFSTILYAIAFLILLPLYLYFVINPRQEDYYLFFNVRRFLIQPLVLILLLPAFYYQKRKFK
jgi:exosortase F-associated protein